MTASITGRKRCGCGQYKIPLANGTMPRHTKLINPPNDFVLGKPFRVHCEGSGKFPPITVAWRKARSERYAAKSEVREARETQPYQLADKPRGQAKRTRRITKRERKGGKR